MMFASGVRVVRSLGWAAPALAVVTLSACSPVFPTPSGSAGAGRETVGPMVRQEVSGLPLPPGEEVDVWLIADPLHSGVIFPLEWLEESGFVAPATVRGSKYVNLSWGDRVAYEEERWLTVREVMQALFLPSESVMEIIAVDYDPRWVFPQQRLYRGKIARGKGRMVADFLNDCTRPAPDGSRPEVIGKATWGEGDLLGCPHNYQFPRFCNSFTAGALASCGYSFGWWSQVTVNSLIRRIVRQGFDRVPALTPEQQQALAHFVETGEESPYAP